MSKSLDAVLAQYEKNKQNTTNSTTPRMTQEERFKMYFNPMLKKGETTGEARIRILPVKEGESPFVEVYLHEIKINGKWLRLYDPKQDGKRSPLNEVKEELYADGSKESKDLAKTYTAKKFYIVKVIDRDNEADGPKFWRFKHNYKDQGPLDKIIPIWKSKGDLTHPETGRDLIISLTEGKTPQGAKYTQISNIIHEDPSPLHTDKETLDLWLNDEKTWLTAYAKKSEDYLEGVAAGFEPKWSKTLKKYVWGNQDETTDFKSTYKAPVTNKSTPVTEVEAEDPQLGEDPDDDLPF